MAWKFIFYGVENFVWFFHGVEVLFPRCGSLGDRIFARGRADGYFGLFSCIVRQKFFHAMEDFFPIFPRYGRFYGDFSTLWKIFLGIFHAMEDFLPWCGKCVSWVAERVA